MLPRMWMRYASDGTPIAESVCVLSMQPATIGVVQLIVYVPPPGEIASVSGSQAMLGSCSSVIVIDVMPPPIGGIAQLPIGLLVWIVSASAPVASIEYASGIRIVVWSAMMS